MDFCVLFQYHGQDSKFLLASAVVRWCRDMLWSAGVLDYRLQCGVPASPVGGSATSKANSSKLDESGEEEEATVDDSNPFASIVSEGESSGEEEKEEGEGESSEHPYIKQQDIFIQEAMNRQTTHDQHCMYTTHEYSVQPSNLRPEN